MNNKWNNNNKYQMKWNEIKKNKIRIIQNSFPNKGM